MSTEYILLECTKCSAKGKKYLPHKWKDSAIMRNFKGWTAKGYKGKKHTLCPKCAAKQS